MSNEDDEEMVQVTVNVPKSIKETAQDKLEYGGITREVRESLQRVAFGEDLNQRSRLERQAEELREKRAELRDQRRELDAEIESIDNKINGIQETISQLSSKEERYESKLEELEYRLRDPDDEWFHLVPTLRVVERIANEVNKEPEGVIQDVKERNPDIPDYAFEPVPPMHERHDLHNPVWSGVPEEDIDLDVEDREAKYR